MKLSDFVVREAILVDMQGRAGEASERSSEPERGRALPTADPECCACDPRSRELGSTGLGRWPFHTRHPTVGLIARSPIQAWRRFRRVDGEPVDSFPSDRLSQPGDHLRAAGEHFETFKGRTFVSFLRQAKSRDQVVELSRKPIRCALNRVLIRCHGRGPSTRRPSREARRISRPGISRVSYQ